MKKKDKAKNMGEMQAFVPYRPYANRERPSRCKWTCFEVDGRSFEILGVRDPVATCVRQAGYPDDPDEQIGEALVAILKRWS